MQAYGILVLQFLIFFLGLNYGIRVLAFSQKDVEIDRYLKQMNKPAIKTIKSPTGELIDCVDIYKQPSLDHPLLQNHRIQVRNILDPTEVNDSTIEIHQDWHANGECPEGTIPVRRIRKSDILRASSLENFGRKSYDNEAHGLHEFSMATKIVTTSGTTPTFGARADINVWNPRTAPNHFSAAQLWVSSNPPLTRIEAGWHVFPKLYGDSRTRLFTNWTDINYKTGCYNLICRGFIQTNKEIALGAVIMPTSSYGGPGYQISVKIFKDVLSGGHWWLTVNGKLLGYWPTEIVPALNNGSKWVMWGGHNTYDLLGSLNTQMGSGHFAKEGNGKAAFFRNISTIDHFGRLEGTEGVKSFVSDPYCYDFQFVGGTSNFFYGGPGRNVNCSSIT